MPKTPHPFKIIPISEYSSMYSNKNKRWVPGWTPFETDFYSEILNTKNGYYAPVINQMLALPIEDQGSFKAKNLTSYSISCTTKKYRKTENIDKFSDLINIDIDGKGNPALKTKEDWKDFRDQVFIDDDRVVAAWLSARQYGVTLVYRCNHEFHKEVFFTIQRDLREKYEIGIDSGTNDEVRLRFVSFDTGIKFRTEFNDISFYLHDPTVQIPKSKNTQRYIVDSMDQYKSNAIDFCIRKVRGAKEGEKYPEFLKAGHLMGGLIASGIIEKEAGRGALLAAASWKKTVKDIGAAYTAINAGIEKGILNPVENIIILKDTWDGIIPDDGIKTHDISLETELKETIPAEPEKIKQPEDQERKIDYVITFNHKPNPESLILTLNDVQILNRGNVASIIAPPGTGKSHNCEAVACSFINPLCTDTFGYKYIGKKPGDKILYVDTERPYDDCYKSLQRIKRRVGLDIEIDPVTNSYGDMTFTSFLNIPKVVDRRDQLIKYISTGLYSFVLLDGVGDFIKNMNDEEEGNEFIGNLIYLGNKFQMAFYMTIHDNPGGAGSKARGHTGSELLRKSQSVFLLKKEEDGSRTLTTDFQHGKNRNDYDKISSSFKWNKDKMMFTTTDYVEKDKQKGRPSKAQPTMSEILDRIYSGITHAVSYDRFVELYSLNKFGNAKAAGKCFDQAHTENSIIYVNGFYERAPLPY